MSKACVICGKQFEFQKSYKIYCSRRCCDHARYLRYKDKYKENNRRWVAQNPEKAKALHKKIFKRWKENNKEHYNSLIMSYYKKNPKFWNIKKCLGEFIRGGKITMERKCKLCGAAGKRMYYHFENPGKASGRKKELQKLIDNGKLYYVCEECKKIKNDIQKFIKN